MLVVALFVTKVDSVRDRFYQCVYKTTTVAFILVSIESQERSCYNALDPLEDGTYSVILQMASGHWQIRMYQESVEKMAFTTPQGLFEFRIMHSELYNAPL